MNIKYLNEQIEAKKAEIRAIAETAIAETRDMSEEERGNYETLSAELRNLQDTLDKFEKLDNDEPKEERKIMENENKMTVEQMEERVFADFIMGKATELRAGEKNFDISSNSTTLPVTISARIIKAVDERCPIFAGATRFSSKGELRIPVYGAYSNHDITCAYTEDFSALTADAGRFTTISLNGYLFGALSLVGKRLENNSQFDVVDFVVNEIADKVAKFVENQLINGTGTNAMTGVLAGCTNTATAATLTMDDLISLQSRVPTSYQQGACWTMSPATLTNIRKLKDANNRYLLQDSVENGFPWKLLGKPIYITDAIANNKIIYGDYAGMAVNVRENVNIEVLRESYAALHAIGVCVFAEMDSKVQNNQMLTVLTVG